MSYALCASDRRRRRHCSVCLSCARSVGRACARKRSAQTNEDSSERRRPAHTLSGGGELQQPAATPLAGKNHFGPQKSTAPADQACDRETKSVLWRGQEQPCAERPVVVGETSADHRGSRCVVQK